MTTTTNSDKVLLSKLNNLALIENESKPTPSNWEVKFELSILEVADIIGSLENYTINIPLMGEYKGPDLSKFDQVVNDLEEWIETKDFPFDKLEGGTSFANMAVSTVAHSIPDIPLESTEMKAFMALIIAGCWLDDVFEELGASYFNSKDTNVGSVISNLYEVCTEIWKGKYDKPKDIPKSIPQLDVGFLLFFYGQQWASSSIPGWNPEIVDPLTRRIEDTAKAMSLSFKSGYSDRVALESYRIIRVYDSGYLPPYEFVLLVKGIVLEPKVRNHLLFKVIQDLSALSSAIVNDIASLPKDIDKSFANNYVLLLARKKSISLKEALDETKLVLNDQIAELEIALDQLALEFEDDETVENFVITSKNLWNGLIAYYSRTTRYGDKIKCYEPNVVKV